MFPALPRTAAALAAATLIPGLIVGISTAPAQAGLIGCDGMIPTIVGDNSDEQIDGTQGPDVILALGGDDTIYGVGGDDTICGGDGDDTVDSGEGADRVFGDVGQDTIFAGAGNDDVRGGSDGDSQYGEEGDDVLGGGRGSDFLVGGVDGDLLMGGLGTDAVDYSSSQGGVVISLRPNEGANDGNAADGPAGSRDQLRSVEAVFGTNLRDTLTGNSKGNFFLPQGGRDLVMGRGGQDFFDLTDGKADKANCGRGRDEVRFDKGVDALKNCEDKTLDGAVGQRANTRVLISQWARTSSL